MPDDVYYLERPTTTVRLGQPSEVYRQFVAGGTIWSTAACCARSAASGPYAATSTPS